MSPQERERFVQDYQPLKDIEVERQGIHAEQQRLFAGEDAPPAIRANAQQGRGRGQREADLSRLTGSQLRS